MWIFNHNNHNFNHNKTESKVGDPHCAALVFTEYEKWLEPWKAICYNLDNHKVDKNVTVQQLFMIV